MRNVIVRAQGHARLDSRLFVVSALCLTLGTLTNCWDQEPNWPTKKGQFVPIDSKKNATCISGNCTDGYGEAKLADGTVYKGQFVGGKASGHGKLIREYTYAGFFNTGLPEGEGNFTDKDRNTLPGKWTKEGDFRGEFDPDFIRVKDYLFVLKPYYSQQIDLSIKSQRLLRNDERDTFGLTVSIGSYSFSLAKYAAERSGYLSGNYFGRHWVATADLIISDALFASNLNVSYYFNGREFSTRSQFDAVERQIRSGGSLFFGLAALHASSNQGIAPYSATSAAPVVGLAGALRFGSLLLRLDFGAGYGLGYEVNPSRSQASAWTGVVPIVWRSALSHDFANWALGVTGNWRLLGHKLANRDTIFSAFELQIYMAIRF